MTQDSNLPATSMTQTKSTPLQGLIEWHRRELHHWQRIRAYKADHDQHVGHADEMVAFHTEAISTLTRMEAEVGRLTEALEGARDALDNAPHGDNCFLHSDGGEYDRCFCGKDSVVAYIDGLLDAEVAEQTAPPQIDKAREIVRRALHAADNGNHAGEQAVLRMAFPKQNGARSALSPQAGVG